MSGPTSHWTTSEFRERLRESRDALPSSIARRCGTLPEAIRELVRQRDEARANLELLQSDLRAAATELVVDVPPPGTVASKLLCANVLLRCERDDAIRAVEASKRRPDPGTVAASLLDANIAVHALLQTLNP